MISHDIILGSQPLRKEEPLGGFKIIYFAGSTAKSGKARSGLHFSDPKGIFPTYAVTRLYSDVQMFEPMV
jgi:hypothetical protein